MTGAKYVAYYRVEGQDLREQEQCVADHARRERAEIIKSYRELEERGAPERPELKKALAYAKRRGASLIVASLKGLAREVFFLRQMKESGVGFVVCDLPLATHLTIHVLLAVAEYEAKLRSLRAREALRSYRARGGKLGAARPEGRNLTPEARAKGVRRAVEVIKAQADEAYRNLAPLIRRLRRSGHSLQDIADHLNRGGHTTRRGRPWNAMQVSRVLKRGA